MKVTAMIVTVMTCVLVVGMAEAKDRLSIGISINAHMVGMTNYCKAKTDLFNEDMNDMVGISQLIGASTLTRTYKVYYPKAFSGLGLMGSYSVNNNLIFLARVGSESARATDSLDYRDSAGNYLDINYEWKMQATDVGIGAGTLIEGFPGKRNDTLIHLYTGSYSLAYTEKGTFSGDLTSAGGRSLTVPIDLNRSFSKMYLEPGASFNFYFTRSRSFRITAAVSYFIIGSETVNNIVYDVSGIKYGLSMGYTFN